MLRRARRFFIGATIYGVLERPTFAVCLWVVHLEPHLLDNMGPLTRDTAVCRGVSLTRGLPRTFVGLACDTEDWAVYIFFFLFQRGDVRFYVVIGTIRETHLLLCRCCDSRLVSLFDKRLSVKQEKSLVKEPRFVETRGAIARAQAKRIGENSIESWCMYVMLIDIGIVGMRCGRIIIISIISCCHTLIVMRDSYLFDVKWDYICILKFNFSFFLNQQ